MFYLIMRLLSENPAHGPEMFGALCDGIVIGIIIYQIVKKVLDKRNIL